MMKVTVYSAKGYDQVFLDRANGSGRVTFHYLPTRLDADTAPLARGAQAVCVFVNDQADAAALAVLSDLGIRHVALRCAGYNNVDLAEARRLGIAVSRVPAYSPNAVAEHTLALILGLSRKIPRAYNRTRDGNFSLEGLLGFDLNQMTVGVIGTGRIGATVLQILQGFGCRRLAHDPIVREDLVAQGAEYVPLDRLFEASDLVTLHCPLTPQTHHLIDGAAIERMRSNVVLINTSRGGLIDTKAVLQGLKSGKIGALGLDVYEEEGDLFFEDLSTQVIQDDVFSRLTTFPNVLITGHQAFFTREAMTNIADTTLANLVAFKATGACPNAVV